MPGEPPRAGHDPSVAWDRGPALVTLMALGEPGSRHAWFAAAGLLLTLAILTGAGALGRLVQSDVRSAPHARVTPNASPGGDGSTSVTPAEDGQTGWAAATATMVLVPQAGYQVLYAADAGHRPTILADGALAIFRFGPQTAGGAFDGIIQVSVGTPESGVPSPGESGPALVSSATLEDLRATYLATVSGLVISRSAQEVGGQLSILLRIDDGATGMRSVALVVDHGRTFILTATGFAGSFGDITDAPAELGLTKFAAGFAFAASPSLVVSLDVGVPGQLSDPAAP